MRAHDGRAIPTFVRQALENKPLTVFGDGSQTRSFCYVDDLIRGLYLLATSDEHLPVNLGNPREFTILELAETVIRVTGSNSEIVFEALPVDDPQVRQPDITRAKQILDWEPEIELEEGLQANAADRGAGPCVSGSLLVAALSPRLRSCGAVGAAVARPDRRHLRRAVVAREARLGVPAVRVARRRGAARQPLLGRPERRRSRSEAGERGQPGRPGLRLGVYDAFVKRAAENRDQGRLLDPLDADLGDRAAGEEEGEPRTGRMKTCRTSPSPPPSGTAEASDPTPTAQPLPPVRFWLAWNEPNNPVFLFPQFRYIGGRYRPVSPAVYAKMCNAIWSGVHLTGLRGEKVACGVTAPRGNNSGAQPRSSLSPIPFLRGMKKAGARFDAYAHHPYYGHPNETPSTPPPLRGTAITLGNLDMLIKELTRLYGQKRVWLTEYGYQTNPPDRSFGVSFVKQARWLTQSFAIARAHPRIDMMIWFLIKDEARIGNGWQSGLYTASGRRKPSWTAFRRMRK